MLFQQSSPSPGLRSLKCCLHYFTRMSKLTQDQLSSYGDIHILRIRHSVRTIDEWKASTKPLLAVSLFDDGIIEDDAHASFHADFANKLISGGTLSGGAAQEEMLFVMKPELLAACFVCDELEDDESVIISGAERFCDYKGKGMKFPFGGNFKDKTPKHAKNPRLINKHIGSTLNSALLEWYTGANLNA